MKIAFLSEDFSLVFTSKVYYVLFKFLDCHIFCCDYILAATVKILIILIIDYQRLTNLVENIYKYNLNPLVQPSLKFKEIFGGYAVAHREFRITVFNVQRF